MIILLNPETGEKVVVDNRDGYKGWTVVERNVTRPRGHSTRVDGKWKVDRVKSRPRNAERLAVEVDELKERLAKLEEVMNASR